MGMHVQMMFPNRYSVTDIQSFFPRSGLNIFPMNCLNIDLVGKMVPIGSNVGPVSLQDSHPSNVKKNKVFHFNCDMFHCVKTK